MTAEPDDDALRARFALLRERDMNTAPHFGALLAHSPSPKRSPRAKAFPALAGIVACAVALLVASAWRSAPSPPSTTDGVSLAWPDWRTPTDTLLTGGDDPLQPLTWAALPTAVLGHPSPHRSQETP
jgi:hypothetical protein